MLDFTFAIVALLAAGLYMLPVMVAIRRKRSPLLSIALLNLFLGWTAIGWLAAYMWARHPTAAGLVARKVRDHRRNAMRSTVVAIVERAQARADQSKQARKSFPNSNF